MSRPPSSTILPAQVVQNLYAAFDQQEFSYLFSLLSPDVVIVQTGELPWGGTYSGLLGAGEYLTRLSSRIRTSIVVDRIISAGENMAVVGWSEGVVIATGAAFRLPIVHVWRIRSGLVCQVQFFVETAAMLAALQAAPPPT